MALFGLFSKRDSGKIRFPVDILSLVRPNREGIPALGAPSVNEYQRLQKALAHIASLQSIPVGAGNKFPKTHPSRIRYFFKAAGFPPAIIHKMVRLHAHGAKNWRGKDWHDVKRSPSARLIKKYESDMVLRYLDEWGLTKHEQPVFAMADHDDMLFHAFAKRSGFPNSDVLQASAIDETYEVYTVDIGPVLADQGRYELYRGCLRVQKEAGDSITKVSFHQPSGGAPGDPLNEHYFGNLFLQDDTATVMAFKSDDEYGGAKSDEDGTSAQVKRMRHNLAVMVLNGLSRREDGLYDKFVGGQLGRALTGTSGVFASPCVLYRVTRERLVFIKRFMQKKHSQQNDGVESSVFHADLEDVFNPISDPEQPVDPEWKYEFMKAFMDTENIISGVEQVYANVMSDLNIPIQRQDMPEDRHVDFNFFGARTE